jgi:hypothetical protein
MTHRGTEETSHEVERVLIERLRDFQELDHVQPSFPALEFRHVGLWLLKLFGECRLRKSGFLPRLDQKLTEAGVCRRENRFGQTVVSPSTGGLNSLKPNLG